MSEGIPLDVDDGLSYAYFDLFRLEENRVAEMWSVKELIPPQEEWNNQNGKW